MTLVEDEAQDRDIIPSSLTPARLQIDGVLGIFFTNGGDS